MTPHHRSFSHRLERYVAAAAIRRLGGCFRAAGLIGLWGLPLLLRGATFTVTTPADSGAGSFRAAILAANAADDLDTIEFQIPGSGPFTIALLTPMPPLAAPVVVDATTQSGYANHPLIELNGANTGSPTVGLRVTGGNCTIRGLALNRFSADGIRLDSSNNRIQGNYIGTDVTGASALGNGQYGIFILGTATNVIGGTNGTDRNVISGHNDTGIFVLNGTANLIQGNYIGLNAAGTSELGNLNNGIVLYNAASNQIGGPETGARNVISGNVGSGINLNTVGATGNIVQGNYVGLNAAGTFVVSNRADGITLNDAPANFLGGTNSGAGNLISGNGQSGIFLSGAGARSNLIVGNWIGLNVTGTAARGNAFAGVTLAGASDNIIGQSPVTGRNVISGNAQEGIFLADGSNNNQIQGNFVGTAADGASALGNGTAGLAVNNAADNRIGGSGVGEGNLISGNTSVGVWLAGGGTSNNWAQGNLIGTDASGRTAVPNVASGVQVESPANLIGGSVAGAGNVISGNGQLGVWLLNSNANGNRVVGNLIGTALGGTNALGNVSAGVGVTDAPNNQIGGRATGEKNVISANGFPANNGGVFIVGNHAQGNEFLGNFVGTDISGQRALPNRYEGFYLRDAGSNCIGSELTGGGNLISGNTTRGIRITNSVGSVIRGNLIGTQADGVTALPNAQFGVELEENSSSHSIGGTVPGAGNRIGFNGGSIYAGVRVRDLATNNAILSNVIFSNAALGIDLSVNGVTGNDGCDLDTGGNQRQNFPMLTQAYGSGGNVGVRGTLESTPNTTFRLQFFVSPECDGSGNGEGAVFLGDQLVTTGPTCTADFVVTLAGAVAAGQVITATATDPANNTSEFSACRTVIPPPYLTLSSPGSGQIALAWTNAAPEFVLKEATNLAPPVLWITVTNPPATINGQFVVTLPQTNGNRFYLLNFE